MKCKNIFFFDALRRIFFTKQIYTFQSCSIYLFADVIYNYDYAFIILVIWISGLLQIDVFF